MNPSKNHKIPLDRQGVDAPDEKIIQGIRSLPDISVPADLATRIMGQLRPRQPSRTQRILRFLSRPQTLTFTPAKWAPVLVCLLILAAGLWVGRETPPLWNPLLQEAEFNYVTGRNFLARNNPDQALFHLRRAVEQVPDKADYHFWLGVAYWAGQDPQNEETSYQKALQLDPEFVPAHLYLGHHYLEQGDWQGALDRYHRVLARVPDQKEALFNAALALQHLGRVREENRMWTAYLQHNPSGTLALQALNHLTANGDLGFQPVTLGDRIRVAPRIGFEKGLAQLTLASLAVLSEIGRDLPVTDGYILHIVVYVQNDSALAEQRAKTIKKQILDLNPALSPHRVRVSWFDLGSVIQVKDQTLTLPADVRIFTQKEPDHPKEEIL